MNPIKNLFKADYYQSILFGKSSFHPIIIVLILGLFLSVKPTIAFYTNVYPIISNLNNKVDRLVSEVFPDELEVKVKNGVASTNVTEPYYVTTRKETIEEIFSLKKDTNESSSKIRLLAIDTKGKAENFENYQSLALLTENSLVYYNNRDGKINIYSLRNIQDLTVNKQNAAEKLKDIIAQYHINQVVSAVLVLGPLFILIGLLIAQYFILLLLSVAVLIINKIHMQETGFWRNFRFTVAIAFLPILIWNLLTLVPIVGIYFVYLNAFLDVLILSIAYIMITNFAKKL